MSDDNPMLDYRMTFQSAMYVVKSKDAVIRAMEAINEGRPQVAYAALHELIMLPGIDEIDSAVMTLVKMPSGMDATDKMRVEFEAELLKIGHKPTDFQRDANGFYRLTDVNELWRGFQIGWKAGCCARLRA